MAELDDTREPGVPHSPEGAEPTQVLPVAEPTQVWPESPWARPADGSSNWAAPDATTRFEATPPLSQPPAAWPQAGQQPYFRPEANQPAAAQHTAQPAGHPAAAHQPQSKPAAGQQPYGQPSTGQQGGPGQPSTGPQGHGQPNTAPQPGAGTQPGQQGYYQQGYYDQQYQQHYAQQHYGQQLPPTQQYPPQYGQPPYGSNGPYYYPQPTPPARTKKRWQIAVAALLAVFVMIASGSFWAARQLEGAAPSTTTTQPAIDPYVPGDDPTEIEPSQQQEETGGSVTSNGVSAAQSAGVVLIEAETASGLAAGTGMILTADGRVLTNYHVVAGSTALSVTDAVTGNTYSATVVGFDQTRDVALIQLKDASGLTTVTIDDDPVELGDKVAAVGNANGGGELVKAAGKVTGTDEDLTVSSDSPWGNTEDLTGLIETNANAVPGDSGGPMFDAENEVLGMTTAGSTREGTSYAVPIATALAVVEQVESGTDAGTVRVGPAGFLGIKVADADQRSSGKTITEVVADSPAAKAGVTAGSTLTRVGDTAITGRTNLATVIRALEPGEQVTIAWTAPNGAQQEATVTLGSSPVN